MQEKLVVTLFVDDTTVYLSENNDFSALEAILRTWCMAAGVQFNVSKTECILIGPQTFHTQFREDRRAKPTHMHIPDTMRIADEGETVRILRVWARNDACDNNTWEKVFKKVCEQLMRWDEKHPTIEGRRCLIQAYIGGGTQFLTAAQGMPPEILSRFKKLNLDFFWEFKKTHTVNKDTLYLPRYQGGAEILDLEVRNDAVYLTWVREYSKPAESRPMWAFVADVIFQHSLTLKWQDKCKENKHILTNFVTQSWHPIERKRTDEHARANA